MFMGTRVSEERRLEIKRYFVLTNSTVRKTAIEYGMSKSTVHKLLQFDCPNEFIGTQTNDAKSDDNNAKNITLNDAVRLILSNNKSERHIRGGMATKKKYQSSTTKKGQKAKKNKKYA